MEFDYIIVGGGTAGCVLANRLSANPKTRVLMLEAGKSDNYHWVHVPIGYLYCIGNPRTDWMMKTAAEPGLNGRSLSYPRGKLLGGCSSVNGMIYMRGQAADYDGWRQMGNTGWGWDDVLPYFLQSEDHHDEAKPLHQSGGEWKVSPQRLRWDILKAVQEGAKEFGVEPTSDFNTGTNEGSGFFEVNQKNGVRWNTAKAFLRPAMSRPNLAVITHAMVRRVILEGGRAVGVEYTRGGQTHVLRARAEVILSGGAINSPQLLQLSGIGPGGLLQQHGVAVAVDNPNVGHHLSDHQGINYTWAMTVPTYNDELRPWWGKLLAGLKYGIAGAGPLAKSINHAGGFFRTDPALPRPNMQLYMQAFSTLIPRDGERPILTPDPWSGLSIGLSNCRPTSRGHIRIASADPMTAPLITANAFSTAQDVTEMLAAVKFLRHLAAQPAMARLIKEELRPGPAVASDAALIDDFRARSGTVYHPSCTCRMGADPATSVLDARLRVRGVGGLRVLDASSFPNLIAGNTNAPSMLMGWRGADLVLEDAR